MNIKYYVSGVLLTLIMAGCTSKGTIPPIPPKSENKTEKVTRTYAEMEDKLNNIRNPIAGEEIGEQHASMSSEVDTLLKDTSQYKSNMSRFERSQLIALKKTKKHYRMHSKKKKIKQVQEKKKDTIDMVNVYENKLKYY